MSAPGATPAVTAVRHAGIVVADLERALAFYRDLLGLVEARTMLESGPELDRLLELRDVRVVTVKLAAAAGPTLVELLAYESPPPDERQPHVNALGASHVALTVADLDALHERLASAGVRFTAPPQVSRDGRAKVAFCFDPDGTPVELVEELQPETINELRGRRNAR